MPEPATTASSPPVKPSTASCQAFARPVRCLGRAGHRRGGPGLPQRDGERRERGLVVEHLQAPLHLLDVRLQVVEPVADLQDLRHRPGLAEDEQDLLALGGRGAEAGPEVGVLAGHVLAAGVRGRHHPEATDPDDDVVEAIDGHPHRQRSGRCAPVRGHRPTRPRSRPAPSAMARRSRLASAKVRRFTTRSTEPVLTIFGATVAPVRPASEDGSGAAEEPLAGRARGRAAGQRARRTRHALPDDPADVLLPAALVGAGRRRVGRRLVAVISVEAVPSSPTIRWPRRAARARRRRRRWSRAGDAGRRRPEAADRSGWAGGDGCGDGRRGGRHGGSFGTNVDDGPTSHAARLVPADARTGRRGMPPDGTAVVAWSPCDWPDSARWCPGAVRRRRWPLPAVRHTGRRCLARLRGVRHGVGRPLRAAGRVRARRRPLRGPRGARPGRLRHHLRGRRPPARAAGGDQGAVPRVRGAAPDPGPHPAARPGVVPGGARSVPP